MWFLALLGWFKWAEQSVASAPTRLTRWISTFFKSSGGNGDDSFATRCLSRSRVLNLKPQITAPLLEIVPGQVLQAFAVVLWKSAEPRCSGMDSGNGGAKQ